MTDHVDNSQVYYGKYRGVVTDIRDPLNMGRIRAMVPDVYGEIASGWALPCVPFAGPETGFLALPSVGAGVWIEFEQGDQEYPIWSGCWWGASTELPPVLISAPYKIFTIKTEGGNTITFDDTAGVGSLTIQDLRGQKIIMNAAGIEITNGSASIKLSGPMVSINGNALEVT